MDNDYLGPRLGKVVLRMGYPAMGHPATIHRAHVCANTVKFQS